MDFTSNLSLMTYGAIGVTGIIVAIATIYDSSDTSTAPTEEPVDTVSSPSEQNSFGFNIFGSKPEEEQNEQVNNNTQELPAENAVSPFQSLNPFATQQKPPEQQIGGKTKKCKTKKQKKSKKARKSRRKKSKQQKN